MNGSNCTNGVMRSPHQISSYSRLNMPNKREETMEKTFTERDLGCWIRGAFGTGNTMLKLREMIHTCPNISESVEGSPGWCDSRITVQVRELATILATADPRKLSDDFCEFDEAESILQDNTEEGLIWVWEAGDLLLAKESEMDENEY
jgi:hypothetical protein